MCVYGAPVLRSSTAARERLWELWQLLWARSSKGVCICGLGQLTRAAQRYGARLARSSLVIEDRRGERMLKDGRQLDADGQPAVHGSGRRLLLPAPPAGGAAVKAEARVAVATAAVKAVAREAAEKG
eukprot:7391360-Prymnesium_polylepis.1